MRLASVPKERWWCGPQAVSGGSPTYLGASVPFDLTTLLAVVRPCVSPLLACG